MSTLLISGAPGRRAVEALTLADQNLQEVQNSLSPHKQAEAYFQWATENAQFLRSMLSEEVVKRLVLTPTFDTLLQASPPGTTTAFFRLVATEIAARSTAIRVLITELKSQVERWTQGELLLVLDTNVYLHDVDLEELDLTDLVGQDQSTRLLVPMVVVDELDNLKSGKSDVRGPARVALKTLTRALEESRLEGWLRSPPQAGTRGARSPVRVEILLDPPRHERLPLADDEIVERAVTVARIADRDVHLVTYDTGMEMRARPTGLRVHKREHADSAQRGSSPKGWRQT